MKTHGFEVLLCVTLLASSTAMGVEETRLTRDGINFHYYPRKATISEQTRKVFLADFFGEKVVWVFESREDYLKILNNYNLPSDLWRKLETAFRQRISVESYAGALVLNRPSLLLNSNVVEVDVETWLQMPADLIQDIEKYQNRYDSIGRYVPFVASLKPHSTTKSLLQTLKILPDNEHYSVFEKSAVLLPRRTAHFVISPALWSVLQEPEKEALIRAYVSLRNSEGVGVRIEVRADNIDLIAARYSYGFYKMENVKDRLRELLSDKTSVWVELEQILPNFIRSFAWDYSPVGWWNCYSTAYFAGCEMVASAYFAEGTDVLRAFETSYRYVEPSEGLRTGDVLLYATQSAAEAGLVIRHADTYIWDARGDLIFTKQGIIKTAPYVFTTRNSSHSLYVEDGRYQLLVLRQVQPGEKSLSEVGGGHTFYFSHPDLKDMTLECGDIFQRSPPRIDL